MAELSPQEIRLFRHNGYLKLRDRLPDNLVEELRNLAYDHLAREVEPVVRNEKGRGVRLSKALERDPIFERSIRLPVVVEPLRSVLGPNIVVRRNRHNHLTFNPSDIRPDAFHRDNLQWTRAIVTIIFFLERTTVENGSTCVVPGSHFWPGLDPGRGVGDDPVIAASGLLDQSVPVPMPPGGLLLLDSLIYHRIGTNTTTETRMSMTFGFHAVDEFAGVEDTKTILIAGEHLYRGNDRG